MAKDFSKIYKKYKGLWVALSKDEKRVIASGKDAKLVFEEAKKKGSKTPLLFKVPEELIAYVGGH